MKVTALVLIIAGLLLNCRAYSQNIDADSLKYQQQRKKINVMLAQRKAKFGEYDQSLTKRSGIFGMQSKQDIRDSNAILTDIVSSDDEILRQIKILLDYRTFQQNKVISRNNDAVNSRLSYVKQLRQQTARLSNELQQEQLSFERTSRVYIVLLVLMASSILFLLLKKRTVKT